MKKNAFKIILKKMITTTLVSTIIFLNPAAAQTPASTLFHESPAVIKYMGSLNDTYLFNVTYTNEQGDKFLLTILDGAGETLFTGTYNEKNFDKRFKLLKEGNDKLSFVIKNLKDHKVQTFEIKTTLQVKEDVVIVRKLM